jgi:beta-glucosidase
MDRSKEASQSREGLLRAYNNGESIPMRKSLEDAYRSSSDDDELDVTDFLNLDASTHKHAQVPVIAYAPARQLANLRRSFNRRSKCILIILAVLVVFWSIIAGGGFWLYKKSPLDGQSPPWYPTPLGGTVSQWAESYKKAVELVKQMSLAEKVNITTGTGWQMGLAVGNTGPAIHVGFPGLAYQDGPLGLRFADNATAFPAGVTVGATFNKDLMYKRGKALGLESRLKGVNVLLGPCVGPLGRMPAGGRNWEVRSLCFVTVLQVLT